MMETTGDNISPLRIAAVDIGSNAIRFLATEFTAASEYTILEYRRYPVRLGHSVFLTGRLEKAGIDVAISVLAEIAQRIRYFDIVNFRCVATSAVRESVNGGEFREHVLRETGLTIQVISGSEEARLVHLAVGSRIVLGDKKWLLVDLGGGSVEVSLVDGNGILWSESHAMGSIRLLEELAASTSEPGYFTNLLNEYVSTLRISSVTHYRKPDGFIATGGNIEQLADLVPMHEIEEKIRVIRTEDLRSSISTLSRLSYRQRIDALGLREDRADVILPAAMVYLKLAELAGAEKILVPDVGLKEGVLLDIADEMMSFSGHARQREQNVLSSSINLGRKYLFDEAHGTHVAELAVSIFDQTRPAHKLGDVERRILLAASIVHDVGSYISLKRHHKHSMYILSESEMPGFDENEILMIANIARYHRKNGPQPHHELYMKLARESRDVVMKLSSILRIADALDRDHLQKVTGVTIIMKNGSAKLEIHGTGDFTLELWAMKKKGELFESVFNVSLSLKKNSVNS